jgi:N-acetylglucosamine-6-sulfatase
MQGRRVHPSRRTAALAVVLLVLVAACSTGSNPADSGSGATTSTRPARARTTRATSGKPNIVLIVADDMRADALGEMPRLNKRPGWARFSQAFVEEPQCCPSRATILTGRYSHHTKVQTLLDGELLDERRTVATLLRKGGYHTGFYGKYLNGYPFGRGHYVPPGWDEFGAYEVSTDYYNYVVNENGVGVHRGSRPADYSTDVFSAFGRKFIDDSDPSKPFFLEMAFNAPHHAERGDPIPAPRDAGKCAATKFPLPLNFNAHDAAGDPPWLARTGGGPPENVIRQRRATCEALIGLDRAVTSLIHQLSSTGRLKNTYIVFFSDNGYSFGERRLIGKGHLYEESVHVPLLVAGPGVKPGTVDRLTSNIDLMPTIADWAGVTPPAGFVDGHSLAGVVAGRAEAHPPTAVLLRGCRTRAPGGLMRGAANREEASGKAAPQCGGYAEPMGRNWGLRTDRYKYVEDPDGYLQLFDLRTDPFEIKNLARDPARMPLLNRLHAQLVQMRGS